MLLKLSALSSALWLTGWLTISPVAAQLGQSEWINPGSSGGSLSGHFKMRRLKKQLFSGQNEVVQPVAAQPSELGQSGWITGGVAQTENIGTENISTFEPNPKNHYMKLQAQNRPADNMQSLPAAGMSNMQYTNNMNSGAGNFMNNGMNSGVSNFMNSMNSAAPMLSQSALQSTPIVYRHSVNIPGSNTLRGLAGTVTGAVNRNIDYAANNITRQAVNRLFRYH